MAISAFELFAKLSLDSSGLQSGLNEAGGLISNLGDKIKSGLAAAAQVGTAALTAASAGIAALTKESFNSYSEYEQLVGGVETLFKDSADTVQQYANNAYQTAGMSANQYMETVTSFAASLIQSTKENTEQLSAEEISSRKAALDEQYEATAAALDRNYEATKNAYAKAYSALQDSLSDEYDARKEALDEQYDALEESLDDEIEALEEAQEKRLNDVEEAQEAEIEAYEKATEEKIALINKEYEESLKLVDEEEYNRIKAIDDQINALNAQAEAEKKAQKLAEQEQKKSELQKAINSPIGRQPKRNTTSIL